MVELRLVSTKGSFKHVECVVEDELVIRLKRLIEHDEASKAAETFNLSLLGEVLQDLGRDFVVLDDINELILNLLALLLSLLIRINLITILPGVSRMGRGPIVPQGRMVLVINRLVIDLRLLVFCFEHDQEFAFLNSICQ